jgi:type IV pilus assembly protein PilA
VIRRVLKVFALVAVLIAGSLWFYYTFIFGDYLHRSQVAEAVSLLGAAKTPLSEYFESNKKWPRTLSEVADSTSGKFTESVIISTGAGGNGQIELTATMRSTGVDHRVSGKTVMLSSPDSGKSWICRAGTAPQNAVPGACRN